MKPFLLLIALLVFGGAGAIAGTLTIAENGTAKAVIVVGSDDPWQKENRGKPGRAKTSAQMASILAAELEKISGAKFDVVKEADLGDVSMEKGRLSSASVPADRRTFILVGEGTLTRKCGVTADGLGPGGIALKSLANAIAIIGRSDHSLVGGGGTGYAVYQFLETLGCRQLWPGDLGKVVPKLPTITVRNLDVRYSPTVVQRSIRFMPHGPRNFEKGLGRLGIAKEVYEERFNAAGDASAWAEWMCLGGDIGIVGGHAGYGLKGGWEKYGKTHPEWFALQADGSRDQSGAKERWRACTSNPGLIEQVANTIIEEANQNPQQRCFSLAPNDGGLSSYCTCDECKKLDPPEAPKIQLMIFEKAGSPNRTQISYPAMTDRYVHYWNAVAERVARTHPDVLLTIDAYGEYSTPPVREKLHPALVVRYVPSDTDGWKGWQKAGAKRIFWRPNSLHSGYREGGLWIWAGTLVENARYFAANGMLAADVQGIYHNWATQGLNYYATARILWNPKLTYRQVLDDYCKTGFGPAAGPVKKYFLRAEQLRSPSPGSAGDRGEKCKMTPEAIAELKGCLRDADRAAQGDETIRKRIAFLSAGLDYTASTVALYGRSVTNPGKDPAILATRWASMKDLSEKSPLAVNVAVVAGHDDLLIRAFGDPGSVVQSKNKSKPDGANADWQFEDQTQTKPRRN